MSKLTLGTLPDCLQLVFVNVEHEAGGRKAAVNIKGVTANVAAFSASEKHCRLGNSLAPVLRAELQRGRERP
jgi:hypothetical protein